MPTRHDNVLNWASDIEQAAIDQAQRAAALPFVRGHVALMPDAHVGLGATVGSVIPTEGAIIPAAVGVDIGCGMIAVELPFGSDALPDDLTDLHSRIATAVPAGVGNIGNQLAKIHIEGAKNLMKRHFIDLEDPDLACLVEGTPEFQAYIAAMQWAQDYALANREVMMDAVLHELSVFLDRPFDETQRINCHHNFTEREHHHGRNMWITRKGAIRARTGDLGVIPGSMGTRSYIVEGRGSSASYCSCSHGAGRRLSRGRARR